MFGSDYELAPGAICSKMCTFHRRLAANARTLSGTREERGTVARDFVGAISFQWLALSLLICAWCFKALGKGGPVSYKTTVGWQRTRGWVLTNAWGRVEGTRAGPGREGGLPVRSALIWTVFTNRKLEVIIPLPRMTEGFGALSVAPRRHCLGLSRPLSFKLIFSG